MIDVIYTPSVNRATKKTLDLCKQPCALGADQRASARAVIPAMHADGWQAAVINLYWSWAQLRLLTDMCPLGPVKREQCCYTNIEHVTQCAVLIKQRSHAGRRRGGRGGMLQQQ